MNEKIDKIVPWIYISVLIALMYVLGADIASSAESATTGFISENTRICAFKDTTPDAIEIFHKYNALINKLEDTGMESLTQAERRLGTYLSHPERCGTMATDYRVVLISVRSSYILFSFDEGYGFVPLTYITWKLSFVADEIL